MEDDRDNSPPEHDVHPLELDATLDQDAPLSHQTDFLEHLHLFETAATMALTQLIAGELKD